MATYSDQAIVRAVLKMHLHGQLINNVFYLRTKVANSPDNEIAAIDVRDHIWRLINDEVSDQLTCESVSVQEIFPNPKDPFELAVAEQGVLPGLSIPTSVAAVVSMKTGLGGRRNRGRKYLAGLERDSCDNSLIDDARHGSLQGTWESINTWFQVGNNLSYTTWGILHRSLNGQPVPLAANSFVPVTSVVVRKTLGTMRSRIPGHGA